RALHSFPTRRSSDLELPTPPTPATAIVVARSFASPSNPTPGRTTCLAKNSDDSLSICLRIEFVIEVSYLEETSHGNFGERAPAGHASIQAMHNIHSESLNFFQSRSRIGICIGHAVSHSLQSEHLIGSRCIPRRLFF